MLFKDPIPQGLVAFEFLDIFAINHPVNVNTRKLGMDDKVFVVRLSHGARDIPTSIVDVSGSMFPARACDFRIMPVDKDVPHWPSINR